MTGLLSVDLATQRCCQYAVGNQSVALNRLACRQTPSMQMHVFTLLHHMDHEACAQLAVYNANVCAVLPCEAA
jgi:hypothetical protein